MDYWGGIIFNKDLKKCTKCGVFKNLFNFNKCANHKTGYKSACRQCQSSDSKEYYFGRGGKEKIKNYTNKNRKKINKRQKEYLKKYNEKRRLKPRRKPRIKDGQFLCSRCDTYKTKDEFFRLKSAKIGIQSKCKICDKNSPHHKNYDRRRETARKYRENNPSVRLASRIRCRLIYALKSVKAQKADKTFNLVGCTRVFLKEYIESLWEPGMNWGNYGCGHNKWQVDHIMALCKFDLTIEVNQYKAMHYTNLRPFWYKDHYKKSAEDRKLSVWKRRKPNTVSAS